MFRALLFVVLAFVPRLAGAAPEVELSVEPSKTAPVVRAVIKGAPSPADRVELRMGKVTVKASSVKTYAQAGEPVALAIVYSGQEVWVGNDDIEPDSSPGHYPGALITLATTFDRLKLATRLPAGSQATLIAYADRAEIKLPLGPVARVTGAAFGTQHDYYQKLGTALVEGVEAGITALSASPATRKVLIVIGDGNDTNNGMAKGRLIELARIAAREAIETHAVIHRSAISEPLNVLTGMIPDAIEVASASALGAVIERVIGKLDDRFYAWFPTDTFPRDGIARVAFLRVGATEVEVPNPLALPKGYELPPDATWRWRVLGAVIALLGISGLAIGWRAIRASSRES